MSNFQGYVFESLNIQEFVEFMLGMIRDALQEISKAQNEHNVVINVAKNVVTNEDKVI